jgi:antitoxin (DNA-binding transcriptional repressor) of toxin-antitoxin stability system
MVPAPANEPTDWLYHTNLVIIMTMIVTNIHDIKAKLSEYLEAVSRGERVVICKRNTPIAELRAITPVRVEPRTIGGAAGRLTLPQSFFQSLPEDLLSDFDGGLGARGVSVAAEARSVSYGKPRRAAPSKPRSKPRSRPRNQR